jgi:Helix-turn-helix domain of resolvase
MPDDGAVGLAPQPLRPSDAEAMLASLVAQLLARRHHGELRFVPDDGGWRDVPPEWVREEASHLLDGLVSLRWGLAPGHDTATPELADIAEVVAVSEWMFRGFRAGLLREVFVAQFEVHPRSLTKADLAAARALLRDPTITVEDAAARVGCSPATLYRYLPGGRGSLVDGSATDRSAA